MAARFTLRMSTLEKAKHERAECNMMVNFEQTFLSNSAGNPIEPNSSVNLRFWSVETEEILSEMR